MMTTLINNLLYETSFTPIVSFMTNFSVHDMMTIVAGLSFRFYGIIFMTVFHLI